MIRRPLPSDPRTRNRAITEARAAGRLGARRVPDTALFPGGLDPSDSALVQILAAFEDGQLERGEA